MIVKEFYRFCYFNSSALFVVSLETLNLVQAQVTAVLKVLASDDMTMKLALDCLQDVVRLALKGKCAPNYLIT